jgi:hypothetical protein
VRHNNNAINYAMQIAGSSGDQDFYGRKTNGNPAQAWRRFVMEGDKGAFSAQNVAGPWNGLTGKTCLAFTNKPNARYLVTVSAAFWAATVKLGYIRVDNNGVQQLLINHYFNQINTHMQVSGSFILTTGAAATQTLSIKTSENSDGNDFCQMTAVEI